jgi:hypothetical protein
VTVRSLKVGCLPSFTLPAGYTTMRQNGLRALEVIRSGRSGLTILEWLDPISNLLIVVQALAHFTHCLYPMVLLSEVLRSVT